MRVIQELQDKAKPRHTVSILTFNYDIAADCALHDSGYVPYYGFEDHEPAHQAIPLLKLHGSLNWTETMDKKQIVPWPMRNYWKAHPARPDLGQRFIRVPIGSQLANQKFSVSTTGEPVLVPPTWNKSDSHRALTKVWNRAATELSEAENIFVVGYSLPETDYFFRYLYALGTLVTCC